MEHLFRSYIRVQRGLDTADGLLETFQTFENNPSGMSPEDRIRLLDLPPRSVQDENIAAVSTLTKAELIQRAIESPKDLTEKEVELIQYSLWTGAFDNVSDAYFDALTALRGISYDYCIEMEERLRRFQRLLYEEREDEAFDSVVKHLSGDDEEVAKAMEQEELEQLNAVFEKGNPWLRQLWKEDQGKKPWGFAVFENPQFTIDNRRELYIAEQRETSDLSLGAIHAVGKIGWMWQLENPAWPTEIATGDESFPVILDALRRRFKELRTQGRGWQHLYPRNEIDPIYGGLSEEELKMGHGLSEGILRNVFLYLDRDSAESVLFSWGRVDDMWIWAVDPDYEPSDNNLSGYQGYLRVRLQQLVNNFYTARRWHANDLSMEDLWRASQKDPKNGAFISMKDEEIFRNIQTHIKHRDFPIPSS
ncbi:hypothetical protein BDV33DRAFT_232458 [Aspergillus novoparasiticus]|uniref:Uncharacterized protein n=1 Tax=Aspergillus novoparasiticus TaxID=986946 RepID=A0A5N6EL12_9EURO|nr:hypothetical protein BDV33DRAFT_232458 [Aspergillus novoparasiticus]